MNEEQEEYLKKLNRSARPWDLLDHKVPRVSEEVYYARLSECKACEHYSKVLGMCKKCGCFMNLKCSLGHAKCPIDKWKAEI